MTPTCKDSAISPLRLESLEVWYGKSRVLHDVSLELHPGEILSFIGPNGAGKTTLFRAILGMVPVTAGRIEFAPGVDRARIGYLPQKPLLDRQVPVSVAELLFLNQPGSRWWLGGSPKRQREASLRTLARVGVEDLIDRPVHDLSGGEFQRVMLAFTLLRDPALLVLDEPSTGVDHIGEEALRRLILELRDGGLSILLASHDLHLVEDVSDRVCCLNGHVCAMGSLDEVLHHHLSAGGGPARHRHGGGHG